MEFFLNWHSKKHASICWLGCNAASASRVTQLVSQGNDCTPRPPEQVSHSHTWWVAFARRRPGCRAGRRASRGARTARGGRASSISGQPSLSARCPSVPVARSRGWERWRAATPLLPRRCRGPVNGAGVPGSRPRRRAWHCLLAACSGAVWLSGAEKRCAAQRWWPQ